MMLIKDVKRGLDHHSCSPTQTHCQVEDVPVIPVPLDSPFTYMAVALMGVVAWKKLTTKGN